MQGATLILLHGCGHSHRPLFQKWHVLVYLGSLPTLRMLHRRALGWGLHRTVARNLEPLQRKGWWSISRWSGSSPLPKHAFHSDLIRVFVTIIDSSSHRLDLETSLYTNTVYPGISKFISTYHSSIILSGILLLAAMLCCHSCRRSIEVSTYYYLLT